MPNRKIKHIIATLVGASQQETMDVYDVDAVHKVDIKNNLTTTVTGTYALDAAQGKVLNDKIASIHDHIYAGTLPDGTDLNDVKDAGTHMISANRSYLNKPHTVSGEAEWGFLNVMSAFDSSNATTIQVYYQNARQWVRFYNYESGNWFTWVMFDGLQDGEFPFAYRTYDYTYSIAANTLLDVRANMFTPQMTTPPNWLFFSFRTWTTSNSNVYLVRMQHGNNTDTSVTLRNNSSSVQTGLLRVSVIYVNNYATSWIHPFDESTLT